MPRMNRTRQGGTHVHLYSSQSYANGDPVYMRAITKVKAAEMEAAGLAYHTPRGMRMRELVEGEHATVSMLGMETMLAASGVGLWRKHEEPGSARHAAKERAETLKYKVWPLIGDDRAVRVRPRISEAERRGAEALLGRV